MKRKTIAVAAVSAGLLLGLSACGNDTANTSAPIAAPSEAAATPSAAASTGDAANPTESSTPAESKSTGGSKPSGTKPKKPGSRTGDPSTTGGCPVKAPTLMAALKLSGQNSADEGIKLEGVKCKYGYAVANRSDGNKNTDDELASFEYIGSKWRYLTGGTADFCRGMPEDVQKLFSKDGYFGCYVPE